MKMNLKIATILTWFNIIIWGLIGGLFLLSALASMNLPILAGVVLLSAIPLNCYAALKLQRSIRQPALSLNSQTPVGIRFVGFIALFLGIYWVGDGLAVLRNPKVVLDFLKDQLSQMPQMAQTPKFKSIGVADVRAAGALALILGLCIVVNVVLNLRLLRWYFLVRKSDVS
jgi:hypothetical protein